MLNQNFEMVSVIIPTYNQRSEKLLKRAIDSVLNQTYPLLEVIVINDSDNPNQDRIETIESFKNSKIRYYEHETNLGPGAARNTGIRHALGVWVALLDDDDWWEPNKLQLQLSNIRDKLYESPVLISGKYYSYKNKSKRIVRPLELPSKNERPDVYTLKPNNSSLHTSTLVAPTWLFKTVPFNENLPRHEDFQWLIDISNKYEITLVFVNQILAHHIKGKEATNRAKPISYSIKWYLQNKNFVHPQVKINLLHFISRKAGNALALRKTKWLFCEFREENLSQIKIIRILFKYYIKGLVKKVLFSKNS